MKRVTVKRKRPNELLENWLEEWREKAELSMKHNFSKALASLQKYPLPLNTGQDCMVLQNFGSKLCMMLDRRLEQHKTTTAGRVIDIIDKPKKIRSKKTQQIAEKLAVATISEPPIRILPHTFDIVLLVDTNERNDGTADELTRQGVAFEIRHLKVGDFAWIARCRQSKKELVLPYIVERKRFDDLGASIKDGRFHEQKFRLKQSGIPNIIYMIESQGKKDKYNSMPMSTLLQASINSQIQDEFTVRFTRDHRDSMLYLSNFSRALDRRYRNKLLIESDKENLLHQSTPEDEIFLMEFQKFNKTSSKIKTYTVKEMFIRQLLQLKGLSLERALVIVEQYPTPYLLRQAFKNAGTEGEMLLASLKYGVLQRKFGPVLSKTLFQLYTNKNLK